MTEYHSIKLNVPRSKAEAVLSLVPDGEPVSGTLISILLDVAANNGVVLSPDAAKSEDRKELLRLAKRVKRLETRLDHALAMLRRAQ